MNKSLFFISVSFAIMTLLISCSSEKVVEGQEIFVEVSSEIKVYYAETDLSSNYPFPQSTFLNDKIMLSHNMIRKSIDTLYFDGDSLKIKSGIFLENDGPRKAEGLKNIVKTLSGLTLFNSKNIMIDQDWLSDIENHRLIGHPLFEGNVFFGIQQGVSFYLDYFFKGYDQKRESLYFFAEDYQSEDIKLISFDLNKRDFLELPMWADVELVKVNKVRYKEVSKNHMPFIYIHDDHLVISYNYSNEFVVIDLNTREVSKKSYPSALFPLNKTVRIDVKEDLELKSIDDFRRVMEIMDEWDKDVAFGNFEILPNRKGFCRLVKSPQSRIEEIDSLNLEIFNVDFEKVGEVNLSVIQPDLSTLYFTYGDRLFFKAKNQENENYLNYYWVKVDY